MHSIVKCFEQFGEQLEPQLEPFSKSRPGKASSREVFEEDPPVEVFEEVGEQEEAAVEAVEAQVEEAVQGRSLAKNSYV